MVSLSPFLKDHVNQDVNKYCNEMLMVFVTFRETPEIELLFGVDCDKVDWLMIANVIVSKYILL